MSCAAPAAERVLRNAGFLSIHCTPGARALIAILLAHRTMPAAALSAAMNCAVSVSVWIPRPALESHSAATVTSLTDVTFTVSTTACSLVIVT
jgi:hypothetical protein